MRRRRRLWRELLREPLPGLVHPPEMRGRPRLRRGGTLRRHPRSPRPGKSDPED